LTLTFKRFKQARVDTIEAFFEAHKFIRFYLYDPSSGVVTVDLSGSSSLGRHTAQFAADDGGAPELEISNVGRCIFDVEIPFFLVD
jgi:hypothetical protein